MISWMENCVIKWSKTKTIVIVSLLALFDVCSYYSIMQLIIFSGLIFFIITKRRKYQKEIKQLIAKLKEEWNTFFKDYSFDIYFTKEVQWSATFVRLYKLEFELKKRNEADRRAQENKKKADEREYNQRKHNNEQNNQKTNNTQTDDLTNALKYFKFRSISDVKEIDLKRIYKSKIIEFHPDNGGSIKDAQILNKHYNVLKKYAH
jgi:hypothetical protein